MGEEFYRQDPTARSSWRLVVLTGRNSRTYKFALGTALLETAGEGRTEIPLADLAVPYAMGLVHHLDQAPQAPSGVVSPATDFLTVAREEAEESKRLGRPTERLLAAAVESMPQMVMQKFHNLPGGTEVPHRFYEVTGRARERIVRLTAPLQEVARSEQVASLRGELAARWSIVETSFAAEIGRSLIEDGVAVDMATLQLTDRRRRRPVAGVTEAVIGFQHGRCLICRDPLVPGVDRIAVDHVFPYSFLRLLGPGRHGVTPDLDAVWNLAPAHAACNIRKSNRPPTPDELVRLAQRNEAIMHSPHPLRRTLQLTLRRHGYTGTRPGAWRDFIRGVRDLLGT